MRAHPTWPGLVLHDDDELAERLGAPVSSRERVHEWPLTVTEKVTLADGRTYAYKAQLPPSIETVFYAAVPGDLVPTHVAFPAPEPGQCAHVATEWIRELSLRARLADSAPDSPNAVLRIGERACEQIASLSPELPVLHDFGGVGAWRTFANRTLDALTREIDAGRYPGLTIADAQLLRAWAETGPVLAAVDTDAVIQHGDLTAHEVFDTHDGLRVIDWQRPLRGPRGIDLANLLHDLGIPPRDHVGEAVTQLSRFVLIEWAVAVSTEILPDVDPAIPASWVRGALRDMFSA